MILCSEKASELLEGKCMGMRAKRKTDNINYQPLFLFHCPVALTAGEDA